MRRRWQVALHLCVCVDTSPKHLLRSTCGPSQAVKLFICQQSGCSTQPVPYERLQSSKMRGCTGRESRRPLIVVPIPHLPAQTALHISAPARQLEASGDHSCHIGSELDAVVPCIRRWRARADGKTKRWPPPLKNHPCALLARARRALSPALNQLEANACGRLLPKAAARERRRLLPASAARDLRE